MRVVSAFLASIIVAFGVAAGGWFVGEGLVRSRLPERSVTVKGLSERTAKADLAFWPIRFVTVGNDLVAVRRELDQQGAAVSKFLVAQGFRAEDFRVEELQVQDLLAQAYRSGPADNRFILTQTILLRSTDVERVAAAARATGQMVGAGVILNTEAGPSQPSYVFTRLNDLKPDMLREATGRAREAAAEFARDAGVNVGGIRSASQGIFEILPAIEVNNIAEPQQIEKKIRVVSTIVYFLD